MKRFEPSRTYSSPSRRASVRSAAAVRAGAGLGQRVRGEPLARASRGRKRRLLLVGARELDRERAELLDREDQAARRADLRDLLDRDERQQRARADAAVLLVEHDPKMPFSRKSSTTSHGNSADRSISAARGAIRSRASVRTSSRISRCSAVSGSRRARQPRLEREPQPEADEHAAGDALEPAGQRLATNALRTRVTASASVEYQTRSSATISARHRERGREQRVAARHELREERDEEDRELHVREAGHEPVAEAVHRGRLVPLAARARGRRRSDCDPIQTSTIAPTTFSPTKAASDAATSAETPTAEATPQKSTPTELPTVVASACRRPPRSALRIDHRGRRTGRERQEDGDAGEDEEPVHGGN